MPEDTSRLAETAPDADSPSSPVRGGSRRRRVSVVAFCVLVGGWAILFLASGSLQKGPSPKRFGGDFVLFVSGARVVQAGGNPYDQRVLYQAERRLLERDGIRAPSFDPYMRVGNPSLLFWALEPVSALSFDTSAKLWALAMYALLALGFLGCLVRMGWRRRWLALPQPRWSTDLPVRLAGSLRPRTGAAAPVQRRRRQCKWSGRCAPQPRRGRRSRRAAIPHGCG